MLFHVLPMSHPLAGLSQHLRQEPGDLTHLKQCLLKEQVDSAEVLQGPMLCPRGPQLLCLCGLCLLSQLFRCCLQHEASGDNSSLTYDPQCPIQRFKFSSQILCD